MRGRLARSPRHLPVGSLPGLVAYGPDLIIAQDHGAAALNAAVYRSVAPQSRMLVCAAEPTPRRGLVGRAILKQADGVLADGEAVAHAVAQLSFPESRIFPLSTPYELDDFLVCDRRRSAVEARRVIYAGDLSPQSGVADLLISVASWAEQHPGQPVEIWWAGDGDLAGVLGAQPLPDNVSQRFLGGLDPAGMARAFGQCGLLVVPSMGDEGRAPVAEGLAAGLPVLGSRRNRRVRQLVREEVNGWLFDPSQPADMFEALSRALATPADQIDKMRDRARTLVRSSASHGFALRIQRAIAAVMPGFELKPAPPQVP